MSLGALGAWVLVLLAVINVREARQERKLAAEQRR